LVVLDDEAELDEDEEEDVEEDDDVELDELESADFVLVEDESEVLELAAALVLPFDSDRLSVR
jgi:hypothetical protein